MRKIIIVYHAYMFGNNYMDMMTEQFRKLLTTGLFNACNKLYIGIVTNPNMYPQNGIEWVNNFWKFSSSKEKDRIIRKVKIVHYSKNDELRDTLRWIRDYSKNNSDDYMMFFHTKGISHGNNLAIEDWRRYMEYFVIENWQDCIKKLDEGYDCCGVLWNKHTPIGEWPHFSGAFYWAKTSYINTLRHDYIDSSWRYQMEFWIGSNLNAKVFEFHNSGLNTTEKLESNQGHYSVLYPRSNYEKRNQ